MTKKAKVVISLIAILVVLAAGIDFYFIRKSRLEEDISKKPVPTVINQKEDPVLSKDPQDQEQFLSSSFLTEFYDLYANRKSGELFDLFTESDALPDKNQKSLLLYGKDLDGNIGGPQLFQSSIAGAYIKDFKIISEQKINEGLLVEVEEIKNRYNSATSVVEKYKTSAFVLLEESGSTYQIKSYYTSNCPDKYCGFLN